MEGIDRAIREIRDLAVKAAGASVLVLPEERQFAIVQGDRSEREAMPAPFRKHKVSDLETLVDLADKEKESWPNAALWYGSEEVVLTYDATDRREKAVLNLPISLPWETLLVLQVGPGGTPKYFPQREFISLLRLNLGVPADVVALFRRIDWKHTRATRAVAGHGQESLGRDIESAVKGTAELPEELLLSVPVWDVDGLRQRYEVRVAVEIGSLEETFAVVPLPGALAAAREQAEGCVFKTLKRLLSETGLEIPVYHGSP